MTVCVTGALEMVIVIWSESIQFVFFISLLKFAGDSSKQVHMEGYAVSGQCMALVRDNCLVPTKDAPELGYIRESSDKQFVPDVYYKVSTVFLPV